MRIRATHWAVALSAAGFVHAGVAAAVLWQPPDSGAVSAGVGGIEVSLGPAGGAPGSVAAAAADMSEAETVMPDATVGETIPADVEPAPEAITSETVQAVEASTEDGPLEIAEVAPSDMAEALPIEAKTVQATAVPVEAAPTDTAEHALLPEAVTPPPAEVGEAKPIEIEETPVQQPTAVNTTAPIETQVARAVVAPPAPKQKPRQIETVDLQTTPQPAPEVSTSEALSLAPPRTVEAVESTAELVTAIAPSAPGAGGKAGVQDSPNAGSANDTSGGGMPGETADFMAQLQAWLEKHKEYPRRARMRRQEGTALLYFEMDRDGQVVRHRLQRSSGHDLLDREVLAMIERAQPLPKLPETMGAPRLELVVPVQFFLR